MSLCTFCKNKAAIETFKPFCSKRCADLDLGQWLGGGYAIPTQESASSEVSEDLSVYQAASNQE